MKKIYTFLLFTLFAQTGFSQIVKNGNEITIKPKFDTNKTYTYSLNLIKQVYTGEEMVTEINFSTPISLTLYSEGEGFNLFEWNSQPMLFFKNNEENKTYNFPTNSIAVKYRTDENYVLGEVSNYDEVVQDYAIAFQQLYNDNATNYDDLASKAALYFIQMYHQFYGQGFNVKNKEEITNLFFNPMKNSFSAAEDEITYAEIDGNPSFNFVQKYNNDEEDNSVKMMNHKTIESYRSQQTGADYKLKSWGNQEFNSNGLIEKIERIVEVKQGDKTIHFIYTLSNN